MLCFLLFLKWTHLSWRGIHFFWVWNPSWATRTMELEDVFFEAQRSSTLKFQGLQKSPVDFCWYQFFFNPHGLLGQSLLEVPKDCVFACVSRKLNISKNCSDGFDHEVPCNNPSLLYIVNPRVYTVLYTCIYVYIYIIIRYTNILWLWCVRSMYFRSTKIVILYCHSLCFFAFKAGFTWLMFV